MCCEDLINCAEKLCVKCLNSFIDKNGNPNIKNEEGYSPLHIAIHNYISTDLSTLWVQILLDGRIYVDVNTRDNSNRSALFDSIIHENEKITKILLERGAIPNLQDEHGFTPLFLAVMMKKNMNIIKTLLDYGADPSIENYYGYTCLDFM